MLPVFVKYLLAVILAVLLAGIVSLAVHEIVHLHQALDVSLAVTVLALLLMIRRAEKQAAGLAHVAAIMETQYERDGANARLTAISSQLPGVAWTTDRELVVSWVRGNLIQETPEIDQVVGRHLSELYGEGDLSLAALHVHMEALENRPGHFDIDFIDGRMLRCSVAPLISRTGEIVGTVGVGVDITDLKRAEQELTQAAEDTLHRLARAAEYRDDETGEHIHRMAQYSEMLAERVRLPYPESDLIRLASLMHDVGKIGTPDHILLKPGALTPEEWEVMKSHTVIGAELLSGSTAPLLKLASTIALTHHERFDGTGYPNGLEGSQIPIVGRIAAIADVFDALTSERVYRPAFQVDEALEMMRAERGKHFDPTLLDQFFELMAPALELQEAGISASPVESHLDEALTSISGRGPRAGFDREPGASPARL